MSDNTTQETVVVGSPDWLGSFALFSEIAYYPSGGMWDYVGCYHTQEQARAEAMRLKKYSEHDWYHIVDRNTMRVVEAEGESCYASAKSLLPNAPYQPHGGNAGHPA